MLRVAASRDPSSFPKVKGRGPLFSGLGPIITGGLVNDTTPVSTFVLDGVSVRLVYVSGHYGDLVRNGDEYFFYFGQACTNLTERWRVLSSRYS